MGSPTLLIVGRGPVAILTARLAAVRGYRPTLLLDTEPEAPALFLGGREGVASLLEEESACILGVDEAPSDPSLPVLMYLGTPHRLVGCRLSSPVSREEEDRFFPFLGLIQSSLGPELDRRILLSVRKTSVRAAFGQRILDWLLEPERQKESLPRALRKTTHQILPFWSSLIGDLIPFAGLASRRMDDPESLRILSHLIDGRARVVFRSRISESDITELPGIDLMTGGTEPCLLERDRKGKGWNLHASMDQSFDRVLSLTGRPDPSLVEASCSFDPEKVSPLWPSGVLLQDLPGRPSLLLLPPTGERTGMTARLLFSPSPGESPESAMLRWVDRWNAESLIRFLHRDTATIRKRRDSIAFPPGHEPSLREVTPLLSTSGHYSEMLDPTHLGVVPEDFWADLSMAIPSLNSSRTV